MGHSEDSLALGQLRAITLKLGNVLPVRLIPAGLYITFKEMYYN